MFVNRFRWGVTLGAGKAMLMRGGACFTELCLMVSWVCVIATKGCGLSPCGLWECVLRFLLLFFLWFFDVLLGVSPFGSVPVLYCSSVVCLYLGGFR